MLSMKNEFIQRHFTNALPSCISFHKCKNPLLEILKRPFILFFVDKKISFTTTLKYFFRKMNDDLALCNAQNVSNKLSPTT